MEFALEGHGYSLGRALRLGVPGVFSRADAAGGVVPPPELCASLHVRAPSSPRAAAALPVAESVRAVLDHLRPRLDAVITHCCFDEAAPDGAHLVIGAHFPSLAADVARDDTVTAGVILALHGDGGPGGRLSVLTRLFRKVCENGAMIHLGDEPAFEIDARLLGAGRARLTEEIERRIVATADPALFTACVAAFRAAEADPLDHRGGVHGGKLRHALTYDTWQSVMTRYAGESWTRWSLANAVTAEAHRARTFSELVRLERIGGLLARAPSQAYEGLPPALLDPAAGAVATVPEHGEKIGAR